MRTLNIYIAVLLILLKSDLNFSQSWELIGGPTGTTPNNVIIMNDGRVLCSTAKGVFISDDYGDSWRISPISQLFNGVYSITERKNGEVLAIVRFGIIKSVDRGENWFKISDMSYLNDYSTIIYESPIDSALYFAKSPSIYKSTDGGFNWYEIWQGGVINSFMVNESGWMYFS
ncbi:MAG TPA: sialidase family protein, partial [Ignavibacteriaceae bacterium]|nr:sialidase family protein [Ignavibacteriaceae bacterium]